MRQGQISFLVTREELSMLEKVLFLEPGLIDGLESAKRDKKHKDKYRVKFAIVELEDAVSALSYFANAMAKTAKEKRQLYELCEKIQNYLVVREKFRSTILRKTRNSL